ncbi:mechanosensitive ion channel family protein [Kiloniella spongiae]|uniref:mechanosensitive ion channel family protein n=1 Tax=Kiloniella spongiae TaxID=1489064 RepID=UPI00069AC29F|nr:mechanosensitive ion channel domain-containing protein [Kiloniella spongiae]
MNVRIIKTLAFCLTLSFFLSILFVSNPEPVYAQTIFSGDDNSASESPEIPEDLSPELIDSLLAQTSDEQLRELFREELLRQAEAKEAEEIEGVSILAGIEMRLTDMVNRIESRVTRWIDAIANLGARGPKVDERLAQAEYGIGGMLMAGAALVFVGFLVAMIVKLLLKKWRGVLRMPRHYGYWERVLRTLTLGFFEVLPIVGFLIATRLFASFIEGPLGPLNGMVWIYYTGISYSWLFVVVARRAFAPDVPQIRIAPLEDEASQKTFSLLQRAVCIGAAGWVGAGFFPTLGWGFPPALITVAIAGTAVAGLLLFALVRNFEKVKGVSLSILSGTQDIRDTREISGVVRVLSAAAPIFLAVYIFFAWVFWLAHWLERGQHQLEGPVGTFIIFFALPIFDRLGREVVGTLLRKESDRAERFRDVFRGTWRVLASFVAAILVIDLWGLDLLSLAKGEDASLWASTGFDILITLLIGLLIWKMIGAALYTEKRISDASEDVDPADAPSASRLDTLTPLFRNTLLGFLGIIVIMTVLSAIGVDIAPLIASAGVVGIAVGFGAQTLVKDIFSGIFFLIDDAFRVGEYIELDKETRGEVESISIRSLQLRHHRGSVITIPFGELKKITNHNRDWVIYKMPFRLEPHTDPQHLKKVVKRVGAEFMEHPEHGPKFIEPLKSQGIFSIDDDSALIMRVKFKCKPRAQFVLRRDIYHRLRAVFAEEGIEFARRKVEVVGPDGEQVDSSSAAALPPDALVESAPSTPR